MLLVVRGHKQTINEQTHTFACRPNLKKGKSLSISLTPAEATGGEEPQVTGAATLGLQAGVKKEGGRARNGGALPHAARNDRDDLRELFRAS